MGTEEEGIPHSKGATGSVIAAEPPLLLSSGDNQIEVDKKSLDDTEKAVISRTAESTTMRTSSVIWTKKMDECLLSDL